MSKPNHPRPPGHIEWHIPTSRLPPFDFYAATMSKEQSEKMFDYLDKHKPSPYVDVVYVPDPRLPEITKDATEGKS